MDRTLDSGLWTLDSGLDYGLDYGLVYGLNFGLDFGLNSRQEASLIYASCLKLTLGSISLQLLANQLGWEAVRTE